MPQALQQSFHGDPVCLCPQKPACWVAQVLCLPLRDPGKSLVFLSLTLFLGAGAEASLLELRPLVMAAVHGAAVGTGASHGLYLEMVTEGHGQGLGQLLSCTGPVSPALGALTQMLHCALGRLCKPSEGLFERYCLPSSYVFLMLERKRG